MISKETYDKIQEYKETGLSILKTTQKLGISYNTTYKWWNKTDEEFTSFQKEHEFVLDNYRQYIIEQLKLCPQINNTLILRRLQENFPDFEIPSATFSGTCDVCGNRPVCKSQSEPAPFEMKWHLATKGRWISANM